ncbi:MAG: ABC transporter substrate-binding protein [Candidatus Dormibacteraceae bacterium]
MAGIKDIITAFNKQYPKITVTYKFVDYSNYVATLRPALAAGSGVDVFGLQPGAMLNEFSSFGEDLTPLAVQYLGSSWKDQLASGAIASSTVKGKLVAAPVGLGGAGTLLVNKTMLDSMGLPVPTAKTSLADWVSECQAIKAKGKTCFGLGAKDEWQNQDFIQSIADSVAPGKFRKAVDGTLPWTDPDLIQALTIYKTMFNNGIVQPGAVAMPGYPDVFTLWCKQNIAMINMGTWELAEYTRPYMLGQLSGAGVSDPNPFTAFLTNFPDVAGKGNTVPIYSDVGGGSAINMNSTNKAAARAWVAWQSFTKGGQQLTADSLTQVPILKGIVPQPTDIINSAVQLPSLAAITQDVQNSAEPRNIAYPDLITALGNALQAIAIGGDPKAEAQKLQTVSAAISR